MAFARYGRAALLAGLAVVVGAQLAPSAGAQVFEGALTGRRISAERMISSVSVSTRQESSASGRQATVSHHVGKAQAEAMLDMNRRIALHDARRQFESMQTAVAGLCTDVRATREADMASGLTGTIRGGLGDVERNWNRDGGSRTDMLVGSQLLRAGPLCPAGEAALGLCDDDAGQYVGGFPAGDTDPSPFLLSGEYGRRSYGSSEAEIGMIYTDTVLPLATMPSADEARQAGVSGLVDRADARHQQAIISLGRKTLTDVILRGIEGGVVEE